MGIGHSCGAARRLSFDNEAPHSLLLCFRRECTEDAVREVRCIWLMGVTPLLTTSPTLLPAAGHLSNTTQVVTSTALVHLQARHPLCNS